MAGAVTLVPLLAVMGAASPAVEARTGQRPRALPVGVVTAAFGGPFLVYLLVRANLRRDA
uniref:Uncharacterized protein n=2 Tax=Nonomuraea gerenzanensis TaxID=93944 RepID=A0A1M4EE68_9ACTN|nr:hypothetical protein BN4615_P6705 [Nonomuraea gerenzanensis]